jgi:hypothetical protein
MSPTAWRIHIPTAVETRVQAIGHDGDGRGPWPSARALDALRELGAARSGPPRSLGTGRGTPLVASQVMAWAGVELEVECRVHPSGMLEAALTAPPWDVLVTAEATEEEWWELVDAFLEAVDARHGAVGDGEALAPDEPSPAALRSRLLHHLGVLVDGRLAEVATPAADAYRTLERSGLVLLLR